MTGYKTLRGKPACGTLRPIAVIGAGIAGLTAARALQDQGQRVVVFEKSRGQGGRAATRRIDHLCFDHGAQYFTARHPVFSRAVDAWREQGLVDIWHARDRKIVLGEIQSATDGQERFVALPGMSALGRNLAEDLTVHNKVQVGPPQRVAGRWRLSDNSGASLGEFDRLVVGIPAPQACRLLGTVAPGVAAQAAAISYQPIWAVLLAFETGAIPGVDTLHFDGGPLGWAADNGSKPGRASRTWVLHATPGWSETRLNDDPGQVAVALAKEFCISCGLDYAGIGYMVAHLWLYARVINPLHTGALWDPGLGLGVCGDWCQGDGIEHAFLSGRAVASRMLAHPADATAHKPASGLPPPLREA